MLVEDQLFHLLLRYIHFVNIHTFYADGLKYV